MIIKTRSTVLLARELQTLQQTSAGSSHSGANSFAQPTNPLLAEAVALSAPMADLFAAQTAAVGRGVSLPAVSKVMTCVLKTRNFVLKMMNFAAGGGGSTRRGGGVAAANRARASRALAEPVLPCGRDRFVGAHPPPPRCQGGELTRARSPGYLSRPPPAGPIRPHRAAPRRHVWPCGDHIRSPQPHAQISPRRPGGLGCPGEDGGPARARLFAADTDTGDGWWSWT